jgi:prepilin signal peptidase PulO-like enzyme (type II secretory pathway)
MTGLPPLLIIFLAVFVYALMGSKTRLKTSAYILGSMVAIVGVGFALTKVWPPGWEGTIGTLTGLMALITGIAASIIQIRKNKEHPPAKSRDLP